MKKLVQLLCLFTLPLTLASDTQHRFKVYVTVSGDDINATNFIENHLKRELRILGDVDIVGVHDNWGYIIDFNVMSIDLTDGRKSGNFAISSYHASRLGEHLFKNSRDYDFTQGNSRFWNPNALALGGKTALVCESIAFFLKKHLTFLANYGL